jgi:hypothetical protein
MIDRSINSLPIIYLVSLPFPQLDTLPKNQAHFRHLATVPLSVSISTQAFPQDFTHHITLSQGSQSLKKLYWTPLVSPLIMKTKMGESTPSRSPTLYTNIYSLNDYSLYTI